MKRVQSLRTKLPLAIAALLLFVIGALSISTYVSVRRTAELAGMARLQAIAQQLAGSVRTNSAAGVTALRLLSTNPDIRLYLRAPQPRRRAAVDAALTRPGAASQVLATELRNLRGDRVASGRQATARVEVIDDADVRRAIARRDTGNVGALRALGDTVVYPTFERVMDGDSALGYIVQWRRQQSSPQGRRAVTDLIGGEAELFIGDTTQGFWTNLIRPVAAPPVIVPPGTDINLPEVVRYERPGAGRQYAAAARARGTPWVVLVEFPEPAVFAPVQASLSQIRTLTGVLAAVSLLAAILLSHWLTRPLTQLADAANAIVAGDRTRRVSIARRDEFGTVANAFNRLAQSYEATHRHGEERFRLLAETVQGYAIFLLNPDGKVATWNAGAERVKGYAASDIVGRHFSTFYPPEDVAANKPAAVLRIATAEGRVEDEGWRVRKDGSRFWGHVIVTALRNESGQLVGFAKVTRDMTDRRQAEEALRARTSELQDALTKLGDAQEMLVRREKLAILGQLSSGVGHELRNPLGVMNNAIYYLETVLTKTAPSDVREYLGILRRQVALSSKIVSDLLDFARVKPPEREPVTLADVVQQQVARLGRLERVQVQVDIPRTLPAALADHVQVGQVIFNLLTNAVQSMEPRGGKLTIRADVDDLHVRLRVIDEGQGIPSQNLEKIFEPLFTTKARGMGLGLAVSRALAIANGGDITVDSREGHGATFTFTLPTVDLGKAA